MLLADVKSKIEYNIKVIRDKEFMSLGLLVANSGQPLLSFIDDLKFLEQISSDITMLLTTQELQDYIPTKIGVAVCENPRKVYFQLHNYLATQSLYLREQYITIIDKTAVIHDSVSISDNNVTIGKRVLIEENCVIRENTVIGDDSIIRAGTVIGGVGFEFKRDGDIVTAVKHVGGVIIGKHVEVQYHGCIDKAIYPWGDTIIDDYTKVDNHVYIAHGVSIGKRVMIVGNSSIMGRVIIGDDSWIGASTTIRNGIYIGKSARVNMGAVVTKNVLDGESVTGNFAVEHTVFIENIKKISGDNGGEK